MLRACMLIMLVATLSPAIAQIVPFGVCAHLGSGMEFNDHQRELQLMQQAGIRWARADFSWSYFEPKDDDFRFDNYDTIVAAAKEHDVTLLPILCYNVEWAFPAHENLDKWCDYVRTVVDRYKDDLKHWEVWNEPNIGFWKPKPDAAQYAGLLIATYQAIKDTDPEAQVVYGGTSGIPFSYLRSTFEQGAFEAFDILAVHPYRYPNVPETARIVEDLQKTWELLDEFGGGKKLWITEYGWPTHINAAVQDGAFLPSLIRYSAKLRFPDIQGFSVAVLHQEGVPGCGQLGLQLAQSLKSAPGMSPRLVELRDLAGLDPTQTQVLIMPTGEHYPADYFEAMLEFVRKGGLLVHLGGVPLYYAQRLQDGQWQGPHAGDAPKETLHVGWKAWWTVEGTPKEARATRLVAPEDSGIVVPKGTQSKRWLTDGKLQGKDKFVPLLAGYNGDEFVGYPVALYLYDSDLKGGFLGTILDIGVRGVTQDTQGLYLPRALLLSLGEGLENIMWYEFRDGGQDATYNEHRFGIINLDMTPKSAYISYQALTTALGQAKFLEKLEVGAGNYCYVFDAGPSKTAALWRASGADAVRLRVTGQDIRVLDYHGHRLSIEPAEGEIEIPCSEKVAYVTGLDEVPVP